MKTNISKADKILRIVIAGIFGFLFASKIVTGILGIVLLIAGIIFVITSLVGFCPLYKLFGISTLKQKS